MNATGVPGMGIDDEAVHTEERAALQAFLDRQRELVVWKLEGCDAAVLQRATTPSGMTPLGIVQHLTDVERSWWRDDVLGQPGLTFGWSDEDPDGEWRVDPAATTEQVLAAYVRECRVCDEAIADLPLDRLGVTARCTVRWVYHHLAEETARHLGHLDVLRELADGVTGEDPGGTAANAELSVSAAAPATPGADRSPKDGGA